MGYNVTLTASDVVLPKENHQEILDRWHEMNDKRHDNVKNGGSYSGGRTISKHYSWMPEDYEKTTHTPQQVLDHLGFEFSENAKGDILVQYYESKTGQEDLFFKEIGDLVAAGGLMKWEGEDEATYAWYFNGNQMKVVGIKEGLMLVSQFVHDGVQEKNQPSEQKTEKPKKNSRYQL